MLDLFEIHKNKSHKIKELWQSIGRDLELDVSLEELKAKYSDLKKEYRKRQIENKRSGSGACTWKYWSLMNEYCHDGKKLLSENVSDSCESSSFQDDNESIPTRKNPNSEILYILKSNSSNLNSLLSLFIKKGEASLKIEKENNKLKKDVKKVKKI